ncbi:MAG: flagellar M-ring protein FliF [Deltaproteobacteria bacterium]|nr:flagellar M-ring protein FliF [Deltaproteobacteria bacterium]
MAEQAADLVTSFQVQFQNFFQNLNTSKKIFLFSALGSVLVGLFAFVYFSQQVTWSPLISGVTQQDAGNIVRKLEEMNIEYVLQPGGNTILVPADSVDKVRLEIASSGIQMGGIAGLELFDENNFGATEFQQRIQYKRALEGELTRLVSQIKSINSARISLALPEKSLFIGDEKHPTASVVLEMANGQRISQKGVLTILNLVSGSISGMMPEDVRVADQSGNLLSKGLTSQSSAEVRDKNYFYQQQVEQRLQQKLVTQLEKITGKDRVEVRVALRMDFDSSEIEEEVVDPDGSAILSEEVDTENSTGSRSIPVGVPGVTSNSPEVRAGASEVANVSNINKKTKRTNFVNSRKHIKSMKAAGRILRMSASVLLDGHYEYVRNESGEVIGSPVYKPRTIDELEKIKQFAMQTLGFEQTRGDTIEVRNMKFKKPLVEVEKLKQQQRETTRKFVIDLIRYVLVGVIIVLLVFMVIRPMVQKLSAKPEDLDLLMGLPTTIGELEGEELEIPTEKETGIPPRDKIIEIARQDPLKTATLVRNWLREKKGPA